MTEGIGFLAIVVNTYITMYVKTLCAEYRVLSRVSLPIRVFLISGCSTPF